MAILLSVVATIACSDRKILGIRSDADRICINQALWTLLHEGLNVVTVILTDRC